MSFYTEIAAGKQAEELTLALHPVTDSLIDDYALFDRERWLAAVRGTLIVNDVLPEALGKRGPDVFNRACLKWFFRNSAIVFVTSAPAPSGIAEVIQRCGYSPKVAVVLTPADRAPLWFSFTLRSRGRRTAVVGRFPPELGGTAI